MTSRVSRQRLSLVVFFPYVGEKGGELHLVFLRNERQLRKHAGEVFLRVDAVAFGAGDEGPEGGVACGGLVVAGEEPVFAAERDAF